MICQRAYIFGDGLTPAFKQGSEGPPCKSRTFLFFLAVRTELMSDEWQPAAIIEQKIALMKQDLFTYVEANIGTIENDIPLFYGYLVSRIEKGFPDISDAVHDQVIDDVTVKVLETSSRSSDIEFIERLFNYAARIKRKISGRLIFDIIYGFKLIDLGKYREAVEALRKFRKIDAIISPAIAYCYHILSSVNPPPSTARTPQELIPPALALKAREEMIDFIRLKPPVNRLRLPQIVAEAKINKIFWFMIKQAIEWFPQEREYLVVGLEKARKDGNVDIRSELLFIATERFFDDMDFLRELFQYKLEAKDTGGAAAVIKQMMQQYPNEIEPIYYGLELSIVTSQPTSYARFRKLATQKNIPSNVLMLLDFTFEIVVGNRNDAFACLEDIKRRLGKKNHYMLLIEYVAGDVFSDDEKKARTAKRVLIDSIDQYCTNLLKMRPQPAQKD